MTNPGWFIGAILFWLAAWAFNEWLVRRHVSAPAAKRIGRIAVPLLFGLAILALWEGVVRGFSVPPILLPAPSAPPASDPAPFTDVTNKPPPRSSPRPSPSPEIKGKGKGRLELNVEATTETATPSATTPSGTDIKSETMPKTESATKTAAAAEDTFGSLPLRFKTATDDYDQKEN